MPNKKPLLITGLSGFVGSTFADQYGEQYELTSLDISNPDNPVDITKYDQVAAAISEHPAQTIIHLAAFTDVTKAWEEKDQRDGLTYKVNVLGTENIAKVARESGKHLIHISTAFVFDGSNPGLYTEQDAMNPIEWYGTTKAKAEEVVTEICDPNQWTIFRIDFPFRQQDFFKPDIVRKTIQAMEKGYGLFADHFFGPTYLEDFAKILDWAITSKSSGLYHATSGEKWSDYQLGAQLLKAHNLPYELKKGSLDDYLKTLSRPYQRNTAMSNEKLLRELPFSLQSIESALKSVSLT